MCLKSCHVGSNWFDIARHCILSKNIGLKLKLIQWGVKNWVLAGVPHLNMAERTYHVVEIFSGVGEIARNCEMELGILLAIKEPISKYLPLMQSTIPQL